MARKILLTSFNTWLPHQSSNASDDLLTTLEPQLFPELDLTLLRQLPVNPVQAGQKAIATINHVVPDVVICCGMAESRQQLSVESNARWEDQKLYTPLELSGLVRELSDTVISHDAGKFVCESLYYQVLKHLDTYHGEIPSLFVHVPVLTPENSETVYKDFQIILEKVE